MKSIHQGAFHQIPLGGTTATGLALIRPVGLLLLLQLRALLGPATAQPGHLTLGLPPLLQRTYGSTGTTRRDMHFHNFLIVQKYEN